MTRFYDLLLWDIATHKKALLRIFSAMFLACFLIIFITTYTLQEELAVNAIDIDRLETLISASCFATMGCFLLAGASYTFAQASEKQGRIAFLMLPASPFRKFVVRLFVQTVGWAVLFCVAFFLANLLNRLFALSFGWISANNLPDVLFRQWFDSISFQIRIGNGSTQQIPSYISTALGIVLLLWIHSIYLLSGCALRRPNWLLVTLSLFFVSGVVNIGLLNIIDELSIDTLYRLPYILLPLLTAATLFNYWFGYRRYTRMQLLCNRFFN